MANVTGKLGDKIEVTGVYELELVESKHQWLVIREDMEGTTFHKMPKVLDCQINSQQLAIESTVPVVSISARNKR